MLLILQSCNRTANLADHPEIIRNDLFAIITLSGVPCDEVVSYELVDDHLDYVASCKTGDQYRISVNPEGRVNVDPHDD